jgi:hypothetical protein
MFKITNLYANPCSIKVQKLTGICREIDVAEQRLRGVGLPREITTRDIDGDTNVSQRIDKIIIVKT